MSTGMSRRMYFKLGESATNQPDNTNQDNVKGNLDEPPKSKRPPSGEKQDLGFYFSNSKKVMGTNSNNRRNKRRGDTKSKSQEKDKPGGTVASVAEEEVEEPAMLRKKMLSPFQKRFQPRHGSEVRLRHGSEVRSSSTKQIKHNRRQTTLEHTSTLGSGATAASLQQTSNQRISFNIFKSSGFNNATAPMPPLEKATPWQFITGNTPSDHVSAFAGGTAHWPRDAVSDALRARVDGKFINLNPTVERTAKLKAKANKGNAVYNDPSVLISMMKGEALPVTSTAALQASIEDKRPMWPPTVASKKHQDKLPAEERLPPMPPLERERVDTFAPTLDASASSNNTTVSSFASPRPKSISSSMGAPSDDVSLLKRITGSNSRSNSRNPMLRTPRSSISGSDSRIRRTATSDSVDTIDSTVLSGMDYFGGGGMMKGEYNKSTNLFLRKFQRWGGSNKAASAKESAELAALNQLDLDNLSLRDMKYLIDKHGLTYTDCSGKVEFIERTRQALHIAAAISRGGLHKQNSHQRSLRRGRPSGVTLRNRPTSSSYNRLSAVSVGGGGGRHMHSVSVSSVDENPRSRSTSRASRLRHSSSTFKNTQKKGQGGGGYHRKLLGSVFRRRAQPVDEVDLKRRTIKSSSSTNVSEHSNDDGDEKPRIRAQSARSASKSTKSRRKKAKKGSPKVNSRKSARFKTGRNSSKLTLNRSSRTNLVSIRKQSTMGAYYKHKPRFLAPLAAQFILVPPPPIRSAPVSGSKSEKAKQDVECAMMAIAELETIRFNLVDEQLRFVESINDLKDEIRIADGMKQKVDLDLIDIDTIPQANESWGGEMKKGTKSSGYKDSGTADFVRGGRGRGETTNNGDDDAVAVGNSVGGPQDSKVMSMTTGRVWEVERH